MLSDQEIMRQVLKFTIPSSILGTPSFHRRHLKDLTTMVNYWDLPSFFVTLTGDKVSSTRWTEITCIETILTKINEQFTWHDTPVECAMTFHVRLKMFLWNYIFGGPEQLGKVNHYVIRYEVQNRGSLHAHIMVWVQEEDIEWISNEIDAHIPFQNNINQYDENSIETTLNNFV